MAQQLQDFTIRMMRSVVEAHATRTVHDSHCCTLAAEYAARLGIKATSSAIPAQATPKDRPVPTPPAPKAPEQDRRPLTEPMARYIRTLRKKISLTLLSPRHRELTQMVLDGDEILFSDARQLIEALKSLVDQSPDARFVEPAYVPEVGPYRVGDDFYLVVTGRETNRRYAKKFNPDTEKYFYVGQAPFAKLTAECLMTAEEAKAFGMLYGKCCNCGRKLTTKKSKDWGYGPDCAEYRGWPY